MIEVIEELPKNNDVCMIKLDLFSGVILEAIYNSDKQEFETLISGLKTNANLVISWELKEV